jgi:hypothetical protein
MNREKPSINRAQILEPGRPPILTVRNFGERNHRRPLVGGRVITVRICICCGEPMTEAGNALSRNPNLCASCSSLADGMEETKDRKIRTVAD